MEDLEGNKLFVSYTGDIKTQLDAALSNLL